MNDFQRLAHAWMNGAITEEEWKRLNDYLRQDNGTAEEFVELMALHQMLRESHAERAALGQFLYESTISGPDVLPVNSGPAARKIPPSPLDLKSRKKTRVYQVAMVVIAATIAISFFGLHTLWGLGSHPVASIDVGSAKVRLVDGEDDAGRAVGSKLYAGNRIRLSQGHVTLPFAEGAIVTLAGPADLEVRTGGHAVLHRGQLIATVPKGARGFTVGTPRADIVDLGTQFGVNVGASRQTHVIVFEGVVEVLQTANGKHEPERHRLTEGEAAYIAENGAFHRFHAIR